MWSPLTFFICDLLPTGLAAAVSVREILCVCVSFSQSRTAPVCRVYIWRMLSADLCCSFMPSAHGATTTKHDMPPCARENHVRARTFTNALKHLWLLEHIYSGLYGALCAHLLCARIDRHRYIRGIYAGRARRGIFLHRLYPQRIRARVHRVQQ